MPHPSKTFYGNLSKFGKAGKQTDLTNIILDSSSQNGEKMSLEKLELLIKNGMDVKTLDKVHPLLPLSAGMCKVPLMTELLKEGANINGKGRKGQTALLRSCTCAFDGMCYKKCYLRNKFFIPCSFPMNIICQKNLNKSKATVMQFGFSLNCTFSAHPTLKFPIF